MDVLGNVRVSPGVGIHVQPYLRRGNDLTMTSLAPNHRPLGAGIEVVPTSPHRKVDSLQMIIHMVATTERARMLLLLHMNADDLRGSACDHDLSSRPLRRKIKMLTSSTP